VSRESNSAPRNCAHRSLKSRAIIPIGGSQPGPISTVAPPCSKPECGCSSFNARSNWPSRTLELAESQAELEGIATLSHWVGVAQQQLGDLPAARASYRRAQEAALAAQRSDLAAYAESALAGLLVETGELAAAASQLESAAQRLRGLGYENELEAVEFNRAVIAIELGNVAVAARVFERIAFAPARPGGTRLQDAAALNLGSLELARRRLPQAKAWLDRVVPASPEDRAIKSLALATLHLRSGELDPAQAQLDNCTSADS
jgi:tetratricopeptide (TPR) repeat protein